MTAPDSPKPPLKRTAAKGSFEPLLTDAARVMSVRCAEAILLECILGFTVAEGPVLLLNLDQADQDILWPQPRVNCQPFYNFRVEGLLLIVGPRVVGSDLDGTVALVWADRVGRATWAFFRPLLRTGRR